MSQRNRYTSRTRVKRIRERLPLWLLCRPQAAPESKQKRIEPAVDFNKINMAFCALNAALSFAAALLVPKDAAIYGACSLMWLGAFLYKLNKQKTKQK